MNTRTALIGALTSIALLACSVQDTDFGDCEDGTCDEFDQYRTAPQCVESYHAEGKELLACLRDANDRQAQQGHMVDLLDQYRAVTDGFGDDIDERLASIWSEYFDTLALVNRLDSRVEIGAYQIMSTPSNIHPGRADERLEAAPKDCYESYAQVIVNVADPETDSFNEEGSIRIAETLVECTMSRASDRFSTLVEGGKRFGQTLVPIYETFAERHMQNGLELCNAVLKLKGAKPFDYKACEVAAASTWNALMEIQDYDFKN